MSSSDEPPSRPQSWEHLFDRDPHSAAGFRLGVVAAMLIHAAVFAVTWPTVAQAPPREPEPALIPFPITNLLPRERQPEPLVVDVPPAPVSGPPVISAPPSLEPVSVSVIEEPLPPGPTVIVTPPVVAPPPPPAAPRPTVVRVGVDVEAPILIHEVDPRYTEPARRAGIQGVVILELLVDTEGSVESVTVLRGLPLGLTESAVDAVEQWRFAPSTHDGLPVRVRYTLTVRFTLA